MTGAAPGRGPPACPPPLTTVVAARPVHLRGPASPTTTCGGLPTADTRPGRRRRRQRGLVAVRRRAGARPGRERLRRDHGRRDLGHRLPRRLGRVPPVGHVRGRAAGDDAVRLLGRARRRRQPGRPAPRCSRSPPCVFVLLHRTATQERTSRWAGGHRRQGRWSLRRHGRGDQPRRRARRRRSPGPGLPGRRRRRAGRLARPQRGRSRPASWSARMVSLQTSCSTSPTSRCSPCAASAARTGG